MVGEPAPPDCAAYVVVFLGDSAHLVPLPMPGELLVGFDRAGVPQTGGEVQELRGELRCSEQGITFVPAAGAKPTLVRGEPCTGPQALVSGDAITLGDATMVVHRAPPRRTDQAVLGGVELLARLHQETERSLRYGGPLSVLVVILPEDAPAPAELAWAVSRAVRMVDVVGALGGRELCVVLPETGADAEIPAGRVLGALQALRVAARVGMASCPSDGTDADSLLTGARAAAARAEPGTAAWLAQAARIFRIGDDEVVAAEPTMLRLFELVQRLARNDLPVLIRGETGVGKEIVARALHCWSPRRDAPLVSLNCAAMPDSLLEAELFGHERGAFTGADSAKPGLLEQASGGTVFLDEVSEASARAQAELLRVLEVKRIRRVGSLEERAVDVRIVAATNRALELEMAEGRFRQDLYFRINAATVTVPPLRQRRLDLPVLARTLLAASCARAGRQPTVTLAPATIQRLLAHEWPGNVRELRNSVDYVVATCTHALIEPDDLPPHIGASAAPWLCGPGAGRRRADAPTPRTFLPLAEELGALERQRMQEALAAADGVQVRAAALLSMPLRTFVTKLKVHGLGSRAQGRSPRSGTGTAGS